jgi:probable F420-dependent oxidoreductase
MTKTLDSPGKLGVWTWPDGFKAPEAVAFARKLEQWGYSAWWIPEAVGRDPFALIGYLAGQTDRLVYATGIANIYARDAHLTKAIKKTLAEMLPARFIMGLGVSHPHLVTRLRGHAWEKPVPKMRQYLEAVVAARYMGAEPEVEAPIVIAALRPKMLELARDKARGAHPYLTTPEHTRRARAILGSGPWLCPEQMLILETDAAVARKVARGNLETYLRAPNYQESLKELGFAESDFAGGGSDALVDALVGWGDEQALRSRIEAHWKAGADHVCIQPYRPDGKPGIDLRALEALAPGA